MKYLFSIAFVLMLTACSVTVPVVVKTHDGSILRGMSTASLSGGEFQVSNEKLSCSGTYDAMDTSSTISMPVSCSDGRNGTVTARRDASLMSGTGVVQLNDGSKADFAFGDAANAF